VAGADSFRVRLDPSGQSFSVAPGESVLNAALRQGVTLQYGCRQGNCSSCKYFLTEGEVDFGPASPYSLSEREREEGWALLCCATPLEDLEIEERDTEDQRLRPLIRPGSRDATVRGAKPLTASLWSLEVEIDTPLVFYPGQFVELAVPGRADQWRAYSIASPSGEPRRLEFILKRLRGGAFSGHVPELAPGTALSLRGPFGVSYLRDGDAPLLFVATGSGIAPLLSMLRSAVEAGDRRQIDFYYGVRTRADIPLVDELGHLQERLASFTFRPTLSAPTPACAWTGATGRVTQLIQCDLTDASCFDAYLCGAPDTCNEVGRLLEAKGIGSGQLFFDRFHPAVEIEEIAQKSLM